MPEYHKIPLASSPLCDVLSQVAFVHGLPPVAWLTGTAPRTLRSCSRTPSWNITTCTDSLMTPAPI